MVEDLQNHGNSSLAHHVERLVERTPVYDIHTHLFDPAFGGLLLWGIDDLLVYHYLIAEAYRYLEVPYEKFWKLTKQEQADLIWEALFLEHSPISEACRGVLTTLHLLGLDVRKRDLRTLRKWFGGWTVEQYIHHCMELAGVKTISMTNSPFDEEERAVWIKGFERDPRFRSALRIDPLLMDWPGTGKKLSQWGYAVSVDRTESSYSEIRKFLDYWTRKMDAEYLMVSLPPSFQYPGQSDCAEILEKAVLPHCREQGLPMALMIGVKRGVNPDLRLAGDGVGRADLEALQNLCARFSHNKFLVTVLSRENQHELNVVARKFPNLHVFGCWWFTNIPSVIEEMTRMRLEMIGLSVTLQHSDARVLDQIIYKWNHSRKVIAKVLADKYSDLQATGWEVSEQEIARDIANLFGGSFQAFCGK